MFLVYSDEENDIESVNIEQNMPKQPTEGTGNSIQEYLRRQWQRNKNG
jgi:predicted Fe-Mo cluster-binding NifX family protein